MHRKIHKLFTLGFLADADARHDPVYGDNALWTQLEIVVQSDGSLKRVAIRRSSGLSGFDAVAVDAVNASAPFPPTPAEIRSSDGNVYLDWQFHRDERGCGSFGVDPHIFSTPPPPASEKALQ